MADLNLEIISPTGVVFKGLCSMAVLPAADGEIGVMNGHETVVAMLKAGQITVYDEKQNVIKTIAVESGFAEMQKKDRLLVLVD